MMQHISPDLLIDYLHRAVPSAQDAQIYAHLQSCEACRKEHDAEAALSEEIRAYALREERELPSSVKAEIWERIRNARPARAGIFAGLFRPAIAVPVAAILAVGVYFGATQLNAPGVPAIDAAYYLQDHAAVSSTIPFTDRAEANPDSLETQAALGTTQTAVKVQTASFTADANP